MEAGMDVVIIDNLENSKREVIDGITEITGKAPYFEEVDLRDRKATFGVFEKYPDIEAIIHFAAYKAVGESVEKPLAYYENNLLSLINLLEAMKKFNVANMVFSSSCTVYGQPEEMPVTRPVEVTLAIELLLLVQVPPESGSN